MSGSIEYILQKEVVPELRRIADALEQVVKSLEVRVNGRVITNFPEGSFDSGYGLPPEVKSR